MGVEFDHNTDLFWQKDEKKAWYLNWSDAKSYCRDLNLAEYSDWKLPDKNTLESRFYRGDGQVSSFYWSSTPESEGSSLAWYLNTYNGRMSRGYKSNYCSVRCIREGF